MTSAREVRGEYDCDNKDCERYLVLGRWPFREFKPPRCGGCGKRLRLVRVLRAMSPEVRERLRRINAERRIPA